jgi:hypothetical protein
MPMFSLKHAAISSSAWRQATRNCSIVGTFFDAHAAIAPYRDRHSRSRVYHHIRHAPKAGLSSPDVDYAQGSGRTRYEFDMLQHGPVLGLSMWF